jgi:hypothetical protein
MSGIFFGVMMSLPAAAFLTTLVGIIGLPLSHLLGRPWRPEVLSDLWEWTGKLCRFRLHPWRRYGRLIADLPLTPASAAVHGDVIAVCGRIERGAPVEGNETAALLVTGHLILEDGSGSRIQIGREGEALVAERFAVGDLIFAMGQVERPEHAGHPFRETELLTRLIPAASGLFLVMRGPRDEACAMLFGDEASLRRDVMSADLLVRPALLLFGALALWMPVAFILWLRYR